MAEKELRNKHNAMAFKDSGEGGGRISETGSG